MLPPRDRKKLAAENERLSLNLFSIKYNRDEGLLVTGYDELVLVCGVRLQSHQRNVYD